MKDAIEILDRWKQRMKGKDRISVKADEVKVVSDLLLRFAEELVTVQEEREPQAEPTPPWACPGAGGTEPRE